MIEKNSPGNNVGTGETKQKLEFGGFVLEHERGSEDVILWNSQNQTPKIAMPIDTFLGIADRLGTVGWVNRRQRTGPTLQKTGT